ncbi:MAG TPA: VIT domain-containing protein [Myxococcales bacterium]|jgi:tetratricopeptide (TPR) repeat protein
MRVVRCLAALAAFVPAAALAASLRAPEGPPQVAESPRPSEAPMSLTASDGTGLKLVNLTARASIEEPLAFTELKLAFQNPQDRVIEGQFRITLPQGATVSRFAMKIDDRWQEGEVVEKQAARRAYEDFLHRRQDPALLEQAAGNEFSARVFPIPARGIKELIVSYSQELATAASPYVLPLKGLPEMGELDVAAFAKGQKAGELKKSRFVPNADFQVVMRSDAARSGLRNANLVLARVKPMAESKPDEIPSAIVLVDTSASRALGFKDELRVVESFVKALAAGAGAKTPVAVACFDQAVQVVFDGPAGSFGEGELKKMKERRALGASDLQRALLWAAERAGKGGMKRVLLIGDGVATAGEVGGDELIAATLKLKAAGVERLDALAVGGIRDDALLRRLVTAGLPKDGVVADAGESFAVLARKLSEATRTNLEVKVEGASWWWPKKIGGVQAGDEVLVYADLPAAAPVKISIAGAPAKVVELPTVDRPLLERSWVQARIASLEYRMDVEADGKAQKAALQKEIVDLSVKNRVLSRYTALLVLETEQDYARFQIDRRALADILTVDQGGKLSLTKRSAEAFAQPKQPPPQKPVAPAKSADVQKKSLAAADKADKDVAEPEKRVADDEKKGEAAPMEEQAKSEAPEAKPSEDMAGAPPPSPPRAEPAPSPAPSAVAVNRPPPRPSPARTEARRARQDEAEARERADGFDRAAPQKGTDPYTGKFKEVLDLLAKQNAKAAFDKAFGWREEDLGDVMALVALGQVSEATGDLDRAARAYGSIIDLFASRADLRRFAGARLEHLKGGAGLDLAIDTFAKAVEQRPDHPASHRLLAFALVKKGLFERAFEAAAAGLKQQYPGGRFAGVERILPEDLGLVAAAWIKAEPGKKQDILNKLRQAGGTVEDKPSVRFVLNWETDANDVDFHIYDAKNNHAFFGSRQLASGGELYADVTTGYGPECFTIRLPKDKRAYPYTLQAHYYSRGPMGYGMGKLQIIDHDGNGNLTFDERPFVVMVDSAFVDMGKVTRQ